MYKHDKREKHATKYLDSRGLDATLAWKEAAKYLDSRGLDATVARMTGMYKHDKREKHATRVPSAPLAKAVWPMPSDDWKEAAKYLDSRGLDATVARMNGWYTSRRAGDRKLRIVIPAQTTNEAIYWQARAVEPDVVLRYQSPAVTRGDAIIRVRARPVYSPSFGPCPVRRPDVVVEGPLDALASASVGFSSIAIMGANPSESVLLHVKRLVGEYKLVIMLDGDRTGRAGAIALLHKLSALGLDCYMPYLDMWVGYKDLASMPADARKGALEVIAASF